MLQIGLTAHRGGRSDVHFIPQIALLRAYLGLLKSDLFEVCITYRFIQLGLIVSERQNLINPVQATERSAVRGYNGKLRTHRGAESWYFEAIHQLAAKDKTCLICLRITPRVYKTQGDNFVFLTWISAFCNCAS